MAVTPSSSGSPELNSFLEHPNFYLEKDSSSRLDDRVKVLNPRVPKEPWNYWPPP